MRTLDIGTAVMLTGRITEVKVSTIDGKHVVYGVTIDSDMGLPVYVQPEAVKVAPWLDDDGK